MASRATVDLSEFEQFKVGHPGGVCSIALAFETLGKEDAEKFRAALDSRIPGAQISRWVSARGVRIRPNTIQRHRNGECRCHD